MSKYIFLIFVTLTLISCGFQLRGQQPLAAPLHKMYLASNNPYSPLCRELEKMLQTSGVIITNSPREANVILNVLSENEEQQLQSVSSNQQTRQYNIVLSLRYSLNTNRGATVIVPEQLTETRSITIQSSQILADNNEVNVLYQQMRSSIAADLLNRLASTHVTEQLKQALAKPAA